ncbi:MAG: GIY-YIG nuclease family protein [Candidatus Accumulibacter sp.]|jgi:Uri superfamily endonuclease|nr:GIY-YIG nuclease family protein [Accumulibacter sp.]
MPEARTYQLLIEVSEPARVEVGKLGCFDFPAGYYVYTGSARKNFKARVARHLSPEKKMRWHIDYLLAARGVRVAEVLDHFDDECEVNQRTPGQVVVDGFGSSDCRSGCKSHLKRVSSPAAAGFS